MNSALEWKTIEGEEALKHNFSCGVRFQTEVGVRVKTHNSPKINLTKISHNMDLNLDIFTKSPFTIKYFKNMI